MATQETVSKPVVVQTTETVTATLLEERTYRAVIEAPLTGPYNIAIYRETVLRDSRGTALSKANVPAVCVRIATNIPNEIVTLHTGSEITVGTILEALPLFFDKWAAEDIAAGRR